MTRVYVYISYLIANYIRFTPVLIAASLTALATVGATLESNGAGIT